MLSDKKDLFKSDKKNFKSPKQFLYILSKKNVFVLFRWLQRIKNYIFIALKFLWCLKKVVKKICKIYYRFKAQLPTFTNEYF